MPSKTYISTSGFTCSFLAASWEQRHGLSAGQRRGFAQFFYLALCGHLESAIADVLEKRCRYMRYLTDWEKIPTKWTTEDNPPVPIDPAPVARSVVNLIEKFEAAIERSPLQSLLQMYSDAFGNTARTDIGPDLADDLDALADLRNLFAHGRDFYWLFDDPFDRSCTASLDSTPTKKALVRLKHAKIISDLDITGYNSHIYEDALHSDEALLYFYDRSGQIVQRLAQTHAFYPPDDFHMLPKLPKL